MMRSNVVAKAPARFIRVSTEELHRFTPAIVGSTGVLVVILVAINPCEFVPKSYVCVPWSSNQQELPQNFAMKSASTWILVNMVLFIITFFSWFISKYGHFGHGTEPTSTGIIAFVFGVVGCLVAVTFMWCVACYQKPCVLDNL
jgi:multisubunit Na+/H+ antiporter MnhB subunit